MLVPHQGPEFRSHFLRRSNNVALIVYHLRKTINRLLNAKPFAAASFAWLMPTQLHRPHHGLAEHRCEACAPIPGDRWERRHQFVCPMSAIGPLFGHRRNDDEGPLLEGETDLSFIPLRSGFRVVGPTRLGIAGGDRRARGWAAVGLRGYFDKGRCEQGEAQDAAEVGLLMASALARSRTVA